jgi:hypothetical protein
MESCMELLVGVIVYTRQCCGLHYTQRSVVLESPHARRPDARLDRELEADDDGGLHVGIVKFQRLVKNSTTTLVHPSST